VKMVFIPYMNTMYACIRLKFLLVIYSEVVYGRERTWVPFE
jgi:hypothetical protein